MNVRSRATWALAHGRTAACHMLSIVLALASGPWLLLPAGLANAGGGGPVLGSIVHDPTAYVEHVRKVQAALVAEGQRAQQLQRQWQSLLLQTRQHEAMLRQLASLRPEALNSTRALSVDNLERVTAYLLRLERLGASLDSLHAQALSTQRAHGLSRLTWPEFVEREQLLAQQRLDQHRDLFADAMRTMRRVEADYAEVAALQSRIPDSEGSHQSLQMLNQQMSLLIAQNAAVQSRLAQHDARHAREAALAESIAVRDRRVRQLELQAGDARSREAASVAERARARAIEAIEARRLVR